MTAVEFLAVVAGFLLLLAVGGAVADRWDREHEDAWRRNHAERWR